MGGYSHGGFKYLTEEQFDELKDDPLIDQWGLRRFVGMPSGGAVSTRAMWRSATATPIEAHWMYCDPVEGRLPAGGHR